MIVTRGAPAPVVVALAIVVGDSLVRKWEDTLLALLSDAAVWKMKNRRIYERFREVKINVLPEGLGVVVVVVVVVVASTHPGWQTAAPVIRRSELTLVAHQLKVADPWHP